jgi:hypothetical protein
MDGGRAREWLRPAAGVAVLLLGAGALVYKVIAGYRHASPDAFYSVEGQRAAAASAASAASAAAASAPPPEAAVAASAASAPALPVAVAKSAPEEAAPEPHDSPACTAVKTEQREVEAALHKPYTEEEGHYLTRRRQELQGLFAKDKCGP